MVVYISYKVKKSFVPGKPATKRVSLSCSVHKLFRYYFYFDRAIVFEVQRAQNLHRAAAEISPICLSFRTRVSTTSERRFVDGVEMCWKLYTQSTRAWSFQFSIFFSLLDFVGELIRSWRLERLRMRNVIFILFFFSSFVIVEMGCLYIAQWSCC